MHNRSDRNGPQQSRIDGRWLLDQYYAVPNSLRSFEEWEVRQHLDLCSRTREELQLERERLGHRLLIDDRPDQWLLERLDAIDRALRDG
jgi:hypothetical protein